MQLFGRAVAPFEDSPGEIERALLDVDLPSLLMSLVHLTGDLALLSGEFRPKACGMTVLSGDLDESAQLALRKAAVKALLEFRERGYTLPTAPSTDQVLVMMSTLACTEIAPEYADLVVGELQVDGTDTGEAPLRSSEEERSDLSVIVIGCGESGLLAAIRLQEAGIPFTVVEKNAGVGGTWYENRYPGCRVDIPNHFYSYSFEASDHWTAYFSKQPELLAYFESVAARFAIDQQVRWRTEVIAATWCEDDSVWNVEVRGPEGNVETLTARAVVSAVGQLNRPSYPDIPGRDTFDGPAFHTARWDDSVDLEGKRVAVIGAGATGFQLVPAIADEVGQLTAYQRTAQWMAPNPIYHESVGPGLQWAIRHVPYYARWYRLSRLWSTLDVAAIASHASTLLGTAGRSR